MGLAASKTQYVDSCSGLPATPADLRQLGNHHNTLKIWQDAKVSLNAHDRTERKHRPQLAITKLNLGSGILLPSEQIQRIALGCSRKQQRADGPEMAGSILHIEEQDYYGKELVSPAQ